MPTFCRTSRKILAALGVILEFNGKKRCIGAWRRYQIDLASPSTRAKTFPCCDNKREGWGITLNEI